MAGGTAGGGASPQRGAHLLMGLGWGLESIPEGAMGCSLFSWEQRQMNLGLTGTKDK